MPPMSSAHQLLDRIRQLEAEFARASSKRDEWDAKMAEIARSLEAFRLVADDLGILAELEDTGGDNVAAGLARAINEIIAAQSGAFGPNEIRDKLPEDLRAAQTASISNTLLRLVKRGELRLVSRGAGSRQSLYERTDLKPEEKASGLPE